MKRGYLKAKSGPNLGGVVNPDSGIAILDSEMQKLAEHINRFEPKELSFGLRNDLDP